MSETELKDEVQALCRQVRELQHERNDWKRKHQSLQAVVRVFLNRIRQGEKPTADAFTDLLSEK